MEFLEGDLADPARVRPGMRRDGDRLSRGRAGLGSALRGRPCCDQYQLRRCDPEAAGGGRAAGVRRVVYAGSSSAYGDTPRCRSGKTCCPTPSPHMPSQSWPASTTCATLTRVYGLETVMLRYFNVFGPYQDPTSHYSGVLAIFCRRCSLESSPRSTATASRAATSRISIMWSRPICWPPRRRPRKFQGSMMNTATGTRVTLNETFAILKNSPASVGNRPMRKPRAGDIRDSLADIGLARKLLGYEPRVDFREGLRRTVEWYRDSEFA